ncbi:hypothetical protein K493DRAFT_25578 [Basidiobolus meristosporus CBS 931.73]|uniref:Uncharacterized protein n=1 Tax=Basidiobolus meristosporus CBS 931.73 TaxID=1314790 RepID=A0A1Y1Z869_9FUNG|nr:hypothetical protein K493DRAFT_25578 [Basidiobolus meristosporus CBS 931.73]|eukprot:ORY06197.1 hypothetical protein K493DRAFT_25578 [Basidiobolus meristosporus CBS 931.73]
MSNKTTEKPQETSQGLMADIWSSIFTPGVNGSVVKVMNISFIAALASLGFLAFATGGNIHAIIVLVLTACLFVAINLLVKEMEKIKAAEEATETKKEN